MNEVSIRRLRSEIVYGPVLSRRFGNSIGLNISGKGKYCSFNCIYCFRGKNDGSPDNPGFKAIIPSIDLVLESFEDWLKESYEDVDDITIAGNAEPTNHPDFPEIIEGVINLRDRYLPNVGISVLTNGTGLLPRLSPRYMDVKYALEKIERPCLKLDSGVPKIWRKISHPYADITFAEWFEAVRILDNPIVQKMLMMGIVDNTTPDELTQLREHYRLLKPGEIQVLNVNKATAIPGVSPVGEKEFEKAKEFLCKQGPSVNK
jgi:wyosine [tRNA(Phe)-imidazoG37] synthetase (radical SAM superfamily)